VSNFFLNISRALHQAKQKKILSPKANQLTIKGLNINDKKKSENKKKNNRGKV
jgi:hypothetical protein